MEAESDDANKDQDPFKPKDDAAEDQKKIDELFNKK
jgi:hypothetical protein